MKKLFASILLFLCLFPLAAQENNSQTPQHIITSKSLEGFWAQVVPRKSEDGGTQLVATGNYKVINFDKTVYTFYNENGDTPTYIGFYGTYKITSDSTYIEHIIKHGLNPSLNNIDSPLRFKLFSPDLMLVKYQMNGIWIPEIWRRISLVR